MIVYTCVFGDTDRLQEPLVKTQARLICFTDQPIQSKGWGIIRVDRLEAPKRECRKYKQRPYTVFPGESVTLWIDAPFALRVDPLVLAQKYPGEMTAFVHDKRKRITDECEAIIRAGKALPEAVRAQLAAYKADGFDTDHDPQKKIHNGGALLRRHTSRMEEFGERWHHEVQTRTLRDQMSIDYCASKIGLEINDFAGTVHQNPYFIRIARREKPTNDY